LTPSGDPLDHPTFHEEDYSMPRTYLIGLLLPLILLGSSASSAQKQPKRTTPAKQPSKMEGEVKLITLDPGHFHAALVQKSMYPGVSPVVSVYALAGPDLDQHLKRIEGYNSRPENPTHWEEKVYTGADFLQQALAQGPGSVVVISGNNREKINYITSSLHAGLTVLADKPMCLDVAGFEKLKQAFKTAADKGLILYDIMTERFEIATILQKALVNDPAVFGQLQKGTPDDPAIVKESVHHLFKYVSGKPLQRPAWFFDVAQQGDGIVDVTTHLVDLIQWEAFPEQVLRPGDVEMLKARRWPTAVSPEQFNKVTGLPDYPDYLRGKLNKDGALDYYSNSEMIYKLKGVHAKVSVIWNFEAPAGAGDTHFSVMKGTKARVIIRQGKDQNYRPELYVEATEPGKRAGLDAALQTAVVKLQAQYPGLQLKPDGDHWLILIPDAFRKDHEAHFGQVMENFLQYLKAGKLPAWEVPNLITKYYTTTKARELALKQK
jgi:predicted dehydrogenase